MSLGLSSAPSPPPLPSLLAVIFAFMNNGVATSGQSDQADPAHDSSLMETTTKFTKKGVEKQVSLYASIMCYTRIYTHLTCSLGLTGVQGRKYS